MGCTRSASCRRRWHSYERDCPSGCMFAPMPKLRPFAILVRCALLGALCGSATLASEGARAVTFSGPVAECPPPGYVDERVGRLLGSAERGPGVAHVLVSKSESGYAVVSAQTKDGRAERRFS